MLCMFTTMIKHNYKKRKEVTQARIRYIGGRKTLNSEFKSIENANQFVGWMRVKTQKF